MEWLIEYCRKKLILSIGSLRDTDYFSTSEFGQRQKNSAFIPPTFLRFLLLFFLIFIFVFISKIVTPLLHPKLHYFLPLTALLISIEMTDWIWLKYYRTFQLAYKSMMLIFSVCFIAGTLFIVKNPAQLTAIRNQLDDYRKSKNQSLQITKISSLVFLTPSSGDGWFVITENETPKPVLQSEAITLCQKNGPDWRLIRSSELPPLSEKLKLNKPTYVWVEDSSMAYMFDGENTAKAMVSSKIDDLNLGICYDGK